MTALKNGEFTKVDVDGHILTVTINRPDVMNAVHPMVSQEMSAIFDAFADDPELWIGIVTGAGDRAFSAGNDLKYHAALRAKSVADGPWGLTIRLSMPATSTPETPSTELRIAVSSRRMRTDGMGERTRRRRCPLRRVASCCPTSSSPDWRPADTASAAVVANAGTECSAMDSVPTVATTFTWAA